MYYPTIINCTLPLLFIIPVNNNPTYVCTYIANIHNIIILYTSTLVLLACKCK